ncbi:TonB-dependent siderophore receptor [Stenotrophomonas sp. PS02289]|uniref:TonB-dependent siderophore receptor n=1 Tax=Stenotrophomonas sp. PS02289 TaxID=2991422 RepID=UPI00249A8791|nr:TonB-dependent siderophore receptor [Stenotrophomonas sp. PS02289]
MTALPRRRALLFVVPTLLASALAQAQDARTLDQVTVVADRASTATKTDTPLTQTPQAISVVSSELFTDRGARNLQETLRYSAGVTADAYGLDTRSDGSTVRGLDPVQYVDGLRRSYGFSPLARTEVYGLERVEVLRGPSSVLYGAGATGGIINAMTKRPTFTDVGGEVGVQLGNFDRKQFQADVGGSLNDAGTVAGRVVGLVRNAGMQTDVIDDDRIYIAPSLSWRGDSSTFTLLTSYQHDKTASSQQFLPVVATLNAAPGMPRLDPGTFLGDKDFDKLDSRVYSVTALFEHSFSDTLSLRSSLRYLDGKTEFRELYPDAYSNPLDPFIDAEKRVVNRNAYGVRPDVRSFTSDNALQFDFATGPLQHQLLAGVDYSDYREEALQLDATPTPIDIYTPVSSGIVINGWNRLPDQRTTQLGVYVQDQIRWADRVSMVLGARRDHARSETEGLPSQTDNATTWRAGLIGEIGAGVSPYISYSESFLPVTGQDIYGRAFQPMEGDQWEGGIKWQPAPNMLVTASAYRITETNRQTNDPENPLNVVQTGEIESKGVELEGQFSFDHDVTMTAAYSRNRAKVTKSNFEMEVNQRLNDTPQELASLWLAKGFQIDDDSRLRVGLGGRYVGNSQSLGFGGFIRTPSYTLVDALFEIQVVDWTMALNITNLADKKYYAPCRNFGDCFTGNPRTVTGTISYRF